MIHYYKDEPGAAARKDPRFNTKCIYVRLDKTAKTYIFIEIDNESGARVCSAGTYTTRNEKNVLQYMMKCPDINDPDAVGRDLLYVLHPKYCTVSKITEHTFLLAAGII